jgi:hypothetical protein
MAHNVRQSDNIKHRRSNVETVILFSISSISLICVLIAELLQYRGIEPKNETQ